MKTQALIVFCTHPNSAEAHCLAKKIVEASLAACVQILPQVSSVYRWDNQTQVENELLMLIKTIEQNYSPLETYLKTNHPYECPEIIATPIDKSEPSYLSWMIKNASI